MAISRRQFFKTAAGAAVAAALAPPIIELIEETVHRTFFLPPAGGWQVWGNVDVEAIIKRQIGINMARSVDAQMLKTLGGAKIWLSTCKPFEEPHLDWQIGFA